MAEFDYIPVNITSDQLVDVVSRGAVSGVLENNEGLLTSGGAFSVIGDLSKLETGTKTNIVSAINEVRRTGGGGGEGGTGKDGEDGGYYIPVVSQPSSDTMKIAFLASKEDMEQVDAQIINLPSGDTIYEDTLSPASLTLPYVITFDETPDSVELEWNTFSSDTINKATLTNGETVGCYYDVDTIIAEWVDTTLTLSGYAYDPDFYIKVTALKGDDAVTYTEQTKTDEEKAQARTNIGAVDEAVVAKMKEDQPNLFARWQTGNLLDNSKMIDGYRVTYTGELAVLASAIASEEYIDISKAQGTHLIMYAYHKDLGAYRTFYRMCFYDANKTVLLYDESGNGGSDLTKSYVEIPEGAVYARVSYITKGANYTYMVVRGTIDTPLDWYDYSPVEMVVVPKDLNEKLAVIDDMAKAKHQDDAEFTVTTLNNSATFSQNDITFVGDELWVSKENATYYTNGTMIFRYKVVNGEFTLVGTCDCDFGHLNTMDYCAANDCLIFGNGGNGTETTGNYFVVVKNPLALGETALIADVGIKYDVDIGYKVQALWGGSNLGDNNIVYLLSNDSANITKVLLLKGDDGEFNGSYVTLESQSLDVWGVQGADIFGDVLYIGGQTGANEYSAVKEISLSDYSTIRTVKRKFYSADGTAITSCVQGIYVDQDAVWICINTGDTTKPVCLTKYRKSN